MSTNSKSTIMVHKDNEEGALLIDRATGIINQSNDERPEWSDGLTTALLAERHSFYNERLGPAYTEAMQQPDMLNYADLGWLTVDTEGDAKEIEADAEFRMNVIAAATGIDREEGFDKPGLGMEGSGHEVEIALDKNRTADEQAALEESQRTGFNEATGTHGA